MPDSVRLTQDHSGLVSAQQLIYEDRFLTPSLDLTKWNPWIGDDEFGRWSDNGLLTEPYSGPNCDPTCSNSNQIQYNDPYPYGYNINASGNRLLGAPGRLTMIASVNNYFAHLGYKYASSAISSHGKMYLPKTGGYIQIKAKMPDSRWGAWGALWLLDKHGAGEIDLQESGYTAGGGVINNKYTVNFHGSPNQQVTITTPTNLSADFHTYGCEYVPGERIGLYLDGQLMHTYTENVPTAAEYFVQIDLEIAGPNTSTFHTVADIPGHPGPFYLEIESVQIYHLADAFDQFASLAYNLPQPRVIEHTGPPPLPGDVPLFDGAIPLVRDEPWSWFALILEDDNTPTDLTGKTILAELRSPKMTTISATVGAVYDGFVEISLTAPQTTSMPLGQLLKLYIAIDGVTEAVVPVNVIEGLFP